MRIGILSNSPKSYSTTRLREAARARGHTLRVLGSQKFSLDIQSGKPDLLYRGKVLSKYSAIIPRVASSSNYFGVAVVRQFEQLGVFCLNPSHALALSRDKLRSMQVLSRHKIGIPHSAFVFDRSDLHPALERLGSAPVVIKALQGSQGAGVILAESASIASAIVEALQVARVSVLIQKFISESRGRDIRAFVVGDRVVAAMRRIADGDEFRSNVHLGGKTEAVNLDEEYERVSIQAAKIMGLRVAGVDLLEGAEGPQVMEVNSSPGLEGIETATKIDVAGAIIEYLEEQVQFPDLDLRERLSLSKGYGVVEIPISKKSLLAGKTLEEAKLSEQEIQVLTITRDSVILPTPRLSEHILPGDKLLCFGKQSTLKALLPNPKRKKQTLEPLTQKSIDAAHESSDSKPSDTLPFSMDNSAPTDDTKGS